MSERWTKGEWHAERVQENEPSEPDLWRVYSDEDTSHEATICELWSGEHDLPATAQLLAAAPALYEALEYFFALLESGAIVRNIKDDGQPGFAMRQLPLVMGLTKAQYALSKARGQS